MKPPQARQIEVAWYRYIECLSYAEIAKKMGTSYEVVRYIYRSIKRDKDFITKVIILAYALSQFENNHKSKIAHPSRHVSYDDSMSCDIKAIY